MHSNSFNNNRPLWKQQTTTSKPKKGISAISCLNFRPTRRRLTNVRSASQTTPPSARMHAHLNSRGSPISPVYLSHFELPKFGDISSWQSVTISKGKTWFCYRVYWPLSGASVWVRAVSRTASYRYDHLMFAHTTFFNKGGRRLLATLATWHERVHAVQWTWC